MVLPPHSRALPGHSTDSPSEPTLGVFHYVFRADFAFEADVAAGCFTLKEGAEVDRLFDAVRGDLELELAGKRLSFEVAKKEFETAQKKAKSTTSALQAIKDEIHAFQLQKLARLNELEVAVSLQLSQLQLLESQRLPAELGAALVFWDAELERLAVRIDELYAETAQEKANRRASYKDERRLKLDCRLMETYIEKLEKQSVAEMKKKFGRLVDLEELESLMVNETVEELRIRLEGEQRLVDAERADRRERLDHLRKELIAVIKDNTNKVGVIQMLKDEKRHLDKGLNFVRKAGIAPHDKRLDDALEIQNLMNTICLQKTQIMEMKQEIWSLSLKSRPHKDPCRRLSVRGGDEGSYDDLMCRTLPRSSFEQLNKQLILASCQSRDNGVHGQVGTHFYLYDRCG
ncbi:Cilia- and flagella-associated protein 44 [Amphibalanus amphitrite]|uniref:Cilia-and flagella-associated protein 44 n=1 Tax=Amphibalanus amphitrite TaxID=1232801 RepID=A0A6A4WAJ7_AMPAM|nr:Cilia- and flagella-associated protein 44 [Amphibalanus amphitrite]